MRHLSIVAAGIAMLATFAVPAAQAREQQQLSEKIRDGAQRTDKDLNTLVRREKLSQEQQQKFDATSEDLNKLREAVTAGKWEGERNRLERAVENLDFLIKHAPLEEADKQTLGIDLYTLQVILDGWTPAETKKDRR